MDMASVDYLGKIVPQIQGKCVRHLINVIPKTGEWTVMSVGTNHLREEFPDVINLLSFVINT